MLSGPLQRGAGALQENALKCGSLPSGLCRACLSQGPKISSPPFSPALSLSLFSPWLINAHVKWIITNGLPSLRSGPFGFPPLQICNGRSAGKREVEL